MMALYIPMQPSSKMPIMDFRRRRSSAIFFAIARAFGGTDALASGLTCAVWCVATPVESHAFKPVRK